MSRSVLAAPVFRQVAGAVESTSSRAVNQVQTLTALLNTAEDPESGHKGGGSGGHLGDLTQLLGTPFFPLTSPRWLLIFFFY